MSKAESIPKAHHNHMESKISRVFVFAPCSKTREFSAQVQIVHYDPNRSTSCANASCRKIKSRSKAHQMLGEAQADHNRNSKYLLLQKGKHSIQAQHADLQCKERLWNKEKGKSRRVGASSRSTLSNPL